MRKAGCEARLFWFGVAAGFGCKTAEAPAVADLEHFIDRVIKFQVENIYTQEQYDIILS